MVLHHKDHGTRRKTGSGLGPPEAKNNPPTRNRTGDFLITIDITVRRHEPARPSGVMVSVLNFWLYILASNVKDNEIDDVNSCLAQLYLPREAAVS